ncbi:hypothetical protein WP50_35330, partial [Lactiplantibacillus plantarum]
MTSGVLTVVNHVFCGVTGAMAVVMSVLTSDSHQQVTNNQITGTTLTKTATVLTTSIPYSTGWQLRVDGQTVRTQVVNKGFVGAKLTAGR